MSAIPEAWAVAVTIPAQDEEQTIARCLESIAAAHAHCGRPANLWMVVVADACADDTASRARGVLRRLGGIGEVIVCNVRSPGTARRLGVAAALRHFRRVPPMRIWLANTDADTRVPHDWLRLHLDHADDGASAVAGIVQLDNADGVRSDVARLYRDTYEVPEDGQHSHVHGANLGVRGDAYLDVGGWSHLSVAEDHCLWNRLKRRGWRTRSCAKSVVLTSARLRGRAIGGFADTLRRRLEVGHG